MPRPVIAAPPAPSVAQQTRVARLKALRQATRTAADNAELVNLLVDALLAIVESKPSAPNPPGHPATPGAPTVPGKP